MNRCSYGVLTGSLKIFSDLIICVAHTFIERNVKNFYGSCGSH